MRETASILCALLMVLVLLPALPPEKAGAEGEIVEQVIDGSLASSDKPVIHANGIVWIFRPQASALSGIQVHDLLTRQTREIRGPSDRSVDDPDIFGNKVVWSDFRGGSGDIYVFDLSTNSETKLTDFTSQEIQPAIDQDRVVWADSRSGDYDIYLADLAANTELRVTTDTRDQMDPDIHGDRIVWVDGPPGSSDIYLYEISTRKTTALTSDARSQQKPKIHGDRVVWEEYAEDFGSSQIVVYEIPTNTKKMITGSSVPGHNRNPAIFGDRIVWEDWRNGERNRDIYMYHLASNTEVAISAAGGNQSSPAIFENRIVWSDGRNSAQQADIYLATLDQTPPTGSIAINAGSPATGNPGIVINNSILSAWAMRFGSTEHELQQAQWLPYRERVDYALSGADGVKTVLAQFKDLVGNMSVVFSDDIILDRVAPTGGLAINGGSVAVNSANVTLEVSPTDERSGLSLMQFSNDGVFDEKAEGWQDYANSAAWTLTPGDGPKTVYARFRDVAGNSSATYSDTIILDTIPPTVLMFSPLGGASSVPLDSRLSVTFSEPMDLTTLQSGGLFLRHFSGSAVTSTLEYDSQSLSLRPVTGLSPLSAYTASVGLVKDLAGNGLRSSLSWSFTTADRPPLTGSSATTASQGSTSTTTLPPPPFASVWTYPNPFYPGQKKMFVQKDTGKTASLKATSFCFTLNQTGHVYVSLFGAKGFLGRMYAKPYFVSGRMFNRYLQPGRYYVGWSGTLNGKLLSPGTYKYVLTANNGNLARTYQGTVTLRQ